MNRARRQARAASGPASRGDRAVVAVGAHDALTAKLIGELRVRCRVGQRPRRRDDGPRHPGREPHDDDRDPRMQPIRIDRATDAAGHRRLRQRLRGARQRRPDARRVRARRDLGDQHRGQPVPEAQQPARRRHETRAASRCGEQARRLRAAKRAQETDDFILIARVESLIAGHGVEDACARADAYVEAGVDAILIHSRDKTLGEIEGFLVVGQGWDGPARRPSRPSSRPSPPPSFTGPRLQPRHPRQPADACRGRGHRGDPRDAGRRAACLRSVDDDIVPVDHIFDLVGTKEAIALEDAGS